MKNLVLFFLVITFFYFGESRAINQSDCAQIQTKEYLSYDEFKTCFPDRYDQIKNDLQDKINREYKRKRNNFSDEDSASDKEPISTESALKYKSVVFRTDFQTPYSSNKQLQTIDMLAKLDQVGFGQSMAQRILANAGNCACPTCSNTEKPTADMPPSVILKSSKPQTLTFTVDGKTIPADLQSVSYISAAGIKTQISSQNGVLVQSDTPMVNGEPDLAQTKSYYTIFDSDSIYNRRRKDIVLLDSDSVVLGVRGADVKANLSYVGDLHCKRTNFTKYNCTLERGLDTGIFQNSAHVRAQVKNGTQTVEISQPLTETTSAAVGADNGSGYFQVTLKPTTTVKDVTLQFRVGEKDVGIGVTLPTN